MCVKSVNPALLHLTIINVPGTLPAGILFERCPKLCMYLQAHIGAYAFNATAIPDTGYQERRVANIVIHPDYDPTTFKKVNRGNNDVALLYLSRPSTYPPIKLVPYKGGWEVQRLLRVRLVQSCVHCCRWSCPQAAALYDTTLLIAIMVLWMRLASFHSCSALTCTALTASCSQGRVEQPCA